MIVGNAHGWGILEWEQFVSEIVFLGQVEDVDVGRVCESIRAFEQDVRLYEFDENKQLQGRLEDFLGILAKNFVV